MHVLRDMSTPLLSQAQFLQPLWDTMCRLRSDVQECCGVISCLTMIICCDTVRAMNEGAMPRAIRRRNEVLGKELVKNAMHDLPELNHFKTEFKMKPVCFRPSDRLKLVSECWQKNRKNIVFHQRIPGIISNIHVQKNDHCDYRNLAFYQQVSEYRRQTVSITRTDSHEFTFPTLNICTTGQRTSPVTRFLFPW